jgi:hypothetical protein
VPEAHHDSAPVTAIHDAWSDDEAPDDPGHGDDPVEPGREDPPGAGSAEVPADRSLPVVTDAPPAASDVVDVPSPRETADVERFQGQRDRFRDLAGRTGVGMTWLARRSTGLPRDVGALTGAVRQFLVVLAHHPFAPGNLPSLATDADLDAIVRCLDRLERIIDHAERARILVLPNAIGVARVNVAGVPFPVIEVCDSRGVAIGADCYVYVLHQCQSTAHLDLAEVISHKPGIFWPDDPSTAGSARLHAESVQIDGPYSVSASAIAGGQVGDHNT